jgi:hypothetical protein
MDQGQIIEVTMLRQFGLGLSLLAPANGRVNLLIVIPFFMISIEFMKKKKGVDWFVFINIFNS